MVAEHRARRIDDVAAGVHERRRLGTHEPARVPARREAQLLRVGLAGHGQPEPLGEQARLGLGQPAHREERAGELRLPEHVQHVALILGRVGAAKEVPRARVVATRLHVVAGRDEIDAELVGAAQGTRRT